MDGVISGNGGLTKTGAGNLTLSAMNTYTGATLIGAGTLTVSGGLSDSAAVTINSGASYIVNADDRIASITGAGNVTLNFILTLGDATNTSFSGVISGVGGLTKVGTGELTLLGANTYTGSTNINVGSLTITGSLSDSTAVTVASGATYNVNASDTVGSIAGSGAITTSNSGAKVLTVGGDGTSTTFSGVLSDGSGLLALTKIGVGSLTLSGTNTYSGVTLLNVGTLIIANDSGLGSTVGGTTVASGAILDLYNVAVGDETITLGGGTLKDVTSSLSGNIVLTANSTLSAANAGDTLTLLGAISGDGYGITKTGAGTVVLSNNNTYTGTTTITAGTFTVSGTLSDSTAVTVASGATYSLGHNDTIASIAGTGAIALNSFTLTVGDANDTSLAGVISGSLGRLVKQGAGTLTLSGTNTYTGGTTINAGAVAVTSTGSLGGTTGNLTMTGTSTLDLQTGLSVGNLVMASGNSITNSTGTSSLFVSATSTLANSITTTGIQTYTGAVTLLANTSLTTTNAAIGFTSTLDSNNVAAYALTTSTGTSSTTFGDAVGATHALASLSTSGNASIGGNVTTVGTQNFGGNITLTGTDITLNTTNSDVTITGNVLSSSVGSGQTYLTSSTWTTTQDGSNPFTLLNIALGQNWTFQGDYLVGNMDGGGLNTILSYGSYTDGVLIRTQGRSDSLYLKGNNYGAIDIFGHGDNGTNGAYVTVKVNYVNSGTSGTLSVFGNNVLKATQMVAGTLNPSDQTLYVGRAVHNSNEGLNATIKNISISTGGSSGSALTINSGNGAAVISGGTSDLVTLTVNSNSASSRVLDAIAGATNLVKLGTGTLTLTGTNTYTGITTITAGTLALSGSGSIGTSSGLLNAATFDISATTSGATITTLSGTGSVVLGTKTLTLSAANDTFAGVISGTGGLVLSSGTQTLTGTNTYTGGTTVNGGTLSFGSDGVLADTGAVNVSGGTLAIGAYNDTVGAVTLSSGSITGTTGVLTGASYDVTNATGTTTIGAILGGSSGLTKTGAGSLVMSGMNQYTGGTSVNGGALSLAADDVMTNSGAILINGATFDIKSHSDTVGLVTVSSGAVIGTAGILRFGGFVVNNNAGQVIVSANLAGSGALTKTGAGTLTLSGSNSYSGSTSIESGATLLLANNSALSGNQLVSNKGILMLDKGIELTALTVNGDVALASDVNTSGEQLYNNQLIIGAGDNSNPLTITSKNSTIRFNSSVIALDNTYAIKRSLTVNANNGNVTINGRFGEESMAFSAYSALINGGVKNLYNLKINAATINLNADITTLETQTYNGAVIIGNNGANGTIRTLLSVDPKIEFMSTIDDDVANTHTLILRAVSLSEGQKPMIILRGAVGSSRPLLNFSAITGMQLTNSLLGDTDKEPIRLVGELIMEGSVTTLKDQTFISNAMQIDGTSSDTKTITFTSKSGKIAFVLGKDFDSGITGGVGTKIILKYSGSGSMSNESQRALKASGLAVVLPVFDYQDAALNSRVINDAWIDQSSNIESDVTVGAPLGNDCQPEKDCLNNMSL
jgi:autotransporter-associated beta strand protein